MFERDQKQIGAFARQSPENMARVYQFVIATVQQALNTVPDILADIEANGEASRHLWAWKPDAYRHSVEKAQETYDIAMAIYDNIADPEIMRHELLLHFAALPGLGLVKGGFMAQLCFGVSGCIDTHNIRRFDLNPSAFAAARFKNAKTAKTRNLIVETYHAIVDKCGGCASLWNEWCNYVAERQPLNYSSGCEVSALHVTAIMGKETA